MVIIYMAMTQCVQNEISFDIKFNITTKLTLLWHGCTGVVLLLLLLSAYT